MEIKELNETFPYIGSGVPRSTDKLHVTDVIRALEKEMGWGYKGKGFEDIMLAAEVGFMWEEVFTTAYRDRMEIVRPGEVELDGIVASPDGLNITEMRLEEYKATWRSTKNLPQENWYWMTQVKAYCHMLGLDSVNMRNVYLMGNYQGSGCLYKPVRITFNEAELGNNWDMIVTQAERMWIAEDMKEIENDNENN